MHGFPYKPTERWGIRMTRQERLYHAAQSVWNEGYSVRTAAGMWVCDVKALIDYLGEDYEG